MFITSYLKWLLLCLLFCTQTAFSQANEKILHIDSLYIYTNLNHYLSFCETSVKLIEGDNFFELIDTTCFQNATASIGSLLNESYISKISIQSSNEYPIDVVLVYGSPELLTVNAIVCEGKLIAIKRAGFMFNWSERDIKEGNMAAMSLKLLPNKIYHIYTLIKRHYMHYDGELNINVALYPIEGWHQKIQNKILFRALFIGLLSAIFLFVLFFYFNNRKPEYFYYLCYLATVIITFMAFENIGGAYIFPENLLLREYFFWFPLLSAPLYILFIRYYINTPKYAPHWDRIAIFIIVVNLLLYLFTCINPFHKYPFLYQYFKFPLPLTIFFAAISSIMFYIWHPSKVRFYLLLGNSIVMLTSIAHLINNQLQWVTEREQLIYGGVFFECLAFAMGLAYKMHLSEKEKIFTKQQQVTLQNEKENLKELNQLKSDFFANISHEFRTPLTLILAPLYKFKQTNTAPSSNDLGMMYRYARRLHQLINQVLDLSKIEAKKMKLITQEQDLVSFLQPQLSAFESMAENKTIDYKITLPNKPLKLFFDGDKMREIINNLLSNAFKFTPTGGKVSVVLNIEESLLEKYALISNQFVVLTISDNGLGIPPAEHHRIFERFYQIDQGKEGLIQGTGIGLALVKELVALHYGHIILESEKGKGAIFKVYLPVGNKHLNANEIVITQDSKIQEIVPIWIDSTVISEGIVNKMEGNKPILLLVEDNHDLHNFISQSLHTDYQLLQAFDGKEGLSMAKTHIPDLIISDIMMPQMDGLTMTKQLKKDSKTSHIPLILLTAKVGQEEKLEGLKTGAIDYLAKPFDIIELNIRIQSLVRQVRAMQVKFSQQIIQLEPAEIDVTSTDNQFIQQLTQFIEIHIDNSQLSVEQMAAEMAFSRVQFYRKLKGLTGMPPSDFLRLYRLKRAKQLIKQQYGNLSEIAYATGFSDPAHFSKCFKKEFGLSPSEFAKS